VRGARTWCSVVVMQCTCTCASCCGTDESMNEHKHTHARGMHAVTMELSVRDITNVEEAEGLVADAEDVGYARQRTRPMMRPMHMLQNHIVIVKALGVLIVLFVCVIAVGVVGIVTSEPCFTAESDCIRVTEPCFASGPECDPVDRLMYIDLMNDNAINGTRYINLTTCIFLHRWTHTSYGSNFTVCQPDTGPPILDIYLNGSLTDTEQWKVLKYMIPQIDASIEKAGMYLTNYVRNTSNK
jgi:hypothetical protein